MMSRRCRETRPTSKILSRSELRTSTLLRDTGSSTKCSVLPSTNCTKLPSWLTTWLPTPPLLPSPDSTSTTATLTRPPLVCSDPTRSWVGNTKRSKVCKELAHCRSPVRLRKPIVTRKVSEYRRRSVIIYLPKRFAGVVFGATLVASLVLGGSALAQGAQSANLQLTPSRDSGVSGTATLTDVEGGVKVELNMRGLPEAGVEHINHIHGGGTCADDRAGRTAPVTIPLNPVVAQEDGTGSATTTIEDVTVSELFSQDKERFILLHAKTKKGQGVPPGIACADLAPRSEGGSFDTLPASGGSPPAVLLAVPLALISGVAGLLILRRLGLCP